MLSESETQLKITELMKSLQGRGFEETGIRPSKNEGQFHQFTQTSRESALEILEKTYLGVTMVEVGVPCGLIIFRDANEKTLGSTALSSPRVVPEDIKVS